MKITDGNDQGILTTTHAMRRKVFGHILDAKKSLPDKNHIAHSHLKKAAGVLGGVVDDSDDDIGGEVFSNQDARRQGAPQATGASAIADKAAAEARRDQVVVAIYKRAAVEKNRDKKAKLEKDAMKLDSMPIEDWMKHEPAANRSSRRTWMGRHFGE